MSVSDVFLFLGSVLIFIGLLATLGAAGAALNDPRNEMATPAILSALACIGIGSAILWSVT